MERSFEGNGYINETEDRRPVGHEYIHLHGNHHGNNDHSSEIINSELLEGGNKKISQISLFQLETTVETFFFLQSFHSIRIGSDGDRVPFDVFESQHSLLSEC